MTEQEEDLIYRMYKLVGNRQEQDTTHFYILLFTNFVCVTPFVKSDGRLVRPSENLYTGCVCCIYFDDAIDNRWDLIAGRIPGRKPEEVERFWIMRHGDTFADKRYEHGDGRRS